MSLMFILIWYIFTYVNEYIDVYAMRVYIVYSRV